MSFSGKTIVVTGGSSGIGLEIIKNLLARGVKNIASLDIHDTNDTASELQKLHPNGQTVIYLKTDVSVRDNVFQSFEEVRSRFGTIDVIVANAGIMNELVPEKMVQVNLTGVINTTHAAIEFMGKTNGGNGGIVLNMASVLGLDYLCACPVYSATKHGVIGLTRAFADDLYKHLGITFVALCPGYTLTPLMNDSRKKIRSEVNPSEFSQMHEDMLTQTPGELAENVANILEDPSASTVYIVDGGKVEPVTFPLYYRKS